MMKNNILRNSGIDIRFGGLPSPAKKNVDVTTSYSVETRHLWSKVVGVIRDGFRERGALGHLSFWAPHKCDLLYLAVCLKSVKVCSSYV